jgi:hypothetical protein
MDSRLASSSTLADYCVPHARPRAIHAGTRVLCTEGTTMTCVFPYERGVQSGIHTLVLSLLKIVASLRLHFHLEALAECGRESRCRHMRSVAVNARCRWLSIGPTCRADPNIYAAVMRAVSMPYVASATMSIMIQARRPKSTVQSLCQISLLQLQNWVAWSPCAVQVAQFLCSCSGTVSPRG